MNEFIEYVCRGVIRSEDAVKNLNRKVIGLAKCHHRLTVSVICIGVAGLLLTSVIADQDKEIKALKKQVADLAVKDEPDDTTDNTEEQKDQEGA